MAGPEPNEHVYETKLFSPRAWEVRNKQGNIAVFVPWLQIIAGYSLPVFPTQRPICHPIPVVIFTFSTRVIFSTNSLAFR
jgi:hypothetical protein